MKQLISRTSQKAGLAPGSLIYTGAETGKSTKLILTDYTKTKIKTKVVRKIEELKSALDHKTNTWIRVEGLCDTTALKEFSDFFNLHSLVLEDIVNIHQRPKVEILEHYSFITLKFLSTIDKDKIIFQQISFIIGKSFIISFHDGDSSYFEPLEKRLLNEKSRLRQKDTFYLSYALLDFIVDHYFLVLEHIGETIEKLDHSISKQQSQKSLKQLHIVRNELLSFRKATIPVFDILGKFKDIVPDSDKLDIYWQDLRDHITQINELSKTYLDIVDGMFNLYFSLLSAQTNRVMQTLTVITLIFLPLSLIAGIYGMNFHYMPELEWKWGYFLILFVMGFLACGIVLWLKRKKWF